MTEADLEELLTRHPTLFHMAETGSWPSINEHGLLSTAALLDLYEVPKADRARIEREHRPRKVPLDHGSLNRAYVRDQIPMTDSGLLRCLPQTITPSDWYWLLNQKVFFWLTDERLSRMLNADAYRDDSHVVLEVDARRLVGAFKDAIWLSPMNTGCTKPFPHPRNENTFARIPNYPFLERPRRERVVELAIDHAVPDIVTYITRVREMRRDEVLQTIYEP